MFETLTYQNRRKALREKMSNGLILILGNNEAPANYPDNTYKFRQDSSFLYFFGHSHPGYAGVIDIDNDEEYFFGNDVDMDDIIWMGPQPSIKELAERVGVSKSFPFDKLKDVIGKALSQRRKIHFLPPYRYDNMMLLEDLTGIKASMVKTHASVELIKAVVSLRAVKEQCEIDEIDKACNIGYEMHTTAMTLCRPGVSEQYIAGTISGIAAAKGSMVSFPTILSMHGEIMHGTPTPQPLEAGRLMLCDAGAETREHYCSDNTRTTPVSGRFTQRQREIYSIVEACHDHTLHVARPGIKWWDVHMSVARLMTEKLKETGLMKGDTEEAVRNGAHAMFLHHGLGHMMGMDVHDMEGLGQIYVGFDEEVRPSEQFGTNCLRCGRRLQEGWVMTDEPGIYFIPALIDEWRSKGLHKDFINYDLLESYKDFGGIRIEDDILITSTGCRMLGRKRIPYHLQDVEDFMAQRAN